MEREKIQALIARYNSQQATPDDIRAIETLLETGSIELQQLKGTEQLENQVARMEFPAPPPDLDDRFYQMLALEKKVKSSFSWRGFFSWPELAPRLAFASVTLLLGIGIGYLINRPTSKTGGDIAKSEIAELKEMVMLALLEKESATDRLKAVSLTEQMDVASSQVTGALLQTLNEDETVNVRLAALEALKPYTRDSHVREELIRSISKQESPLVQVALAELMAEFRVKSSVKELEKIMQSERTPADVKSKIKQSIDVII
jgi:hypothetical protein